MVVVTSSISSAAKELVSKQRIKITPTMILSYDMWKMNHSLEEIKIVLDKVSKSKFQYEHIMKNIATMFEYEKTGLLGFEPDIQDLAREAKLVSFVQRVSHTQYNLLHTVDLVTHFLREQTSMFEKGLKILSTIFIARGMLTAYEMELLTTILTHGNYFYNVMKNGYSRVAGRHYLTKTAHTAYFFSKVISDDDLEEIIELNPLLPAGEKRKAEKLLEKLLIPKEKDVDCLVKLINRGYITERSAYRMASIAENCVYRGALVYVNMLFKMAGKRKLDRLQEAYLTELKPK